MDFTQFLQLAEEYPWVWIPFLAYVGLNFYVKVSSAPTRKEGLATLLKNIAQRVSVTDFKGGKTFTPPGAGR